MQQHNIWTPAYKDTLLGHFIFETKSFLGRVFSKRSPQNQSKFLNLGCGDNYYDGFVNADFFNGFRFWKNEKRKTDWQLDFRYPLNCNDNFWEGVFTEHVLEHLYHDDVISLLYELERTMRPGATIRIIVPDLQQCCEDYCDNSLKPGETGASLMWNLSQNWAHKSLWDFNLMKEALERVGFVEVRKCQFSEGGLSAILKDSPHRKERSLYVEARKKGK